GFVKLYQKSKRTKTGGVYLTVYGLTQKGRRRSSGKTDVLQQFMTSPHFPLHTLKDPELRTLVEFLAVLARRHPRALRPMDFMKGFKQFGKAAFKRAMRRFYPELKNVDRQWKTWNNKSFRGILDKFYRLYDCLNKPEAIYHLRKDLGPTPQAWLKPS